MGLSMRERQAVTAQLAPKYRQAGKKKKSEMLDQFVELTGYNRKYAIFLLQNWGKRRVGRAGNWNWRSNFNARKYLVFSYYA